MGMIYGGKGSLIIETLNSIINSTENLRKKAESFRIDFKKSHSNIDAFQTLANNMSMTKELVKYYLDSWSADAKNTPLTKI